MSCHVKSNKSCYSYISVNVCVLLYQVLSLSPWFTPDTQDIRTDYLGHTYGHCAIN